VTDTSPLAPRRAAIVGAGYISDLHIRGIRRTGAQVVAVVDSDLRRARDRAMAHGIPAAFAGIAEMMRAHEPEVVHILTPPAAHAPLAITAMEWGADVYVEKPMAVSPVDCDRMIAASRRTGRRLCIGHCLVYDPLMQRALDAIGTGAIGDVIHATAVTTFDPEQIPGFQGKMWYRELAGGFLEDLASHPASLLLRVIGAPQGVAGAEDRRLVRRGLGISALVEAERGTGTLIVSLGARPEEMSLEVRGTRGTLRANFSTMTLTLDRERALPRPLAGGLRNLAQAVRLTAQTVGATARAVTGRTDTTTGIHSLIAAFYDAIARGESSPVEGEEGRQAVELIRAVWPMPILPARSRQRVVARAAETASAYVARGQRTALVTGATGFIGTHLVRALSARGVFVRALARDEERGRALAGPNVEVVLGDLADPASLEGIADGMEIVFHLASVMQGRWWEDFERIDVDGARRLIAEARRARVTRLVFTSTLGTSAIAGLRDGAVVTEEMIDVPERIGHLARAKLLVEHMLLEAQRAGEFEAVIVRPGCVYGPGASPFLEHVPEFGALSGDGYRVFGDGQVRPPLAFVDNVVDALWLAATMPGASGETFSIVDDRLPTQREFVTRLAALTGRPLRLRRIPRPVAALLGLGAEAAGAMLRTPPPATRALLRSRCAKLSFDTSRAQRVLGWAPRVDWEEGLRRAVAAAGFDVPEPAFPVGRVPQRAHADEVEVPLAASRPVCETDDGVPADPAVPLAPAWADREVPLGGRGGEGGPADRPKVVGILPSPRAS
jgi:nucleoside-diphosphate-sugar epimerase/predicted dehydrogenase